MGSVKNSISSPYLDIGHIVSWHVDDDRCGELDVRAGRGLLVRAALRRRLALVVAAGGRLLLLFLGQL